MAHTQRLITWIVDGECGSHKHARGGSRNHIEYCTTSTTTSNSNNNIHKMLNFFSAKEERVKSVCGLGTRQRTHTYELLSIDLSPIDLHLAVLTMLCVRVQEYVVCCGYGVSVSCTLPSRQSLSKTGVLQDTGSEQDWFHHERPPTECRIRMATSALKQSRALAIKQKSKPESYLDSSRTL
jgi:hypothetical protein